MKYFTFLLLFSFTSFDIIAQNIVWEDEIIISTSASEGNVRPRMTIDPDGHPMIIMTKSQNGQVYFTKESGGTFSTPIALLPTSLQSYIANWTGPDMGSHGDTVVVVFKAKPFETGHVYTVRSTDGGLSFSDTIRADSHPTGMSWMPSMTMDANGNPLITYMAHDANYTNPKYVYTRSNDAGLTYEQEQIITTTINGEACDCCPAEIVADGSKNILLFRNNETNIRDIYGVYSNDNGNTFPSSDNVDESAWLINSCPASGPHGVISGNELFTTFMSAGTGTEQVFVSRSTATTSLTFQEKVSIPLSGTGYQNYPRITAENNLLYVTWSESVSNNVDIYTSWCPTNDLTQLSANIQIANSSTVGIQTNPEILIQDDVVHLVYQNSTGGNLIYRRGQIGFVGLTGPYKIHDNIYPNPISAGEMLSLPDAFAESELEWIDSKGNSVLKQFIGNQIEIITPELEKGIYFIKSNKYFKTYKISIL